MTLQTKPLDRQVLLHRPHLQPLPTAFHVMTKPIGPICNLDCRYCFYLEKEHLYEGPPSWQMPANVLEEYIRQYIQQQDAPEISFAWQGGEPTLLGVDFFRQVVSLQQKYAGGKRIQNALQTNGVLLDDEWCLFLAEHEFLVGLSIDGPPDLHNTYRVDKGGKPTFDKVMRGLDLLKRHQVEFNTLTVVNRANSQHPLKVYRFLKEIGSNFVQFIPLVERTAQAPISQGERLIQLSLAPPPGQEENFSPVTPWSVRSADYGRFLVEVFEEWVRQDVARVFLQIFEVALGNWMGIGGGLCVFSEKCGTALAMEHNGDVYSCDHYVYPEYRLGNIMDQPLAEMILSPQQQKFGCDKRDTLPRYCLECEVRFACHGECPKHRFIRTPEGEWGLNYLCAAYKRFFTHIDPYMQTMAKLLNSRRSPAEIMQILAARERASSTKPAPPRARAAGRNDPCPCGSGLKYKKCCAIS